MEYWEAMKLVQEGNKVRQHDWDLRCYIVFKDGDISHQNGCVFRPQGDHFKSTWELYKKPIIKRAQYMYKSIYDAVPEITTQLLKDDAEFGELNHSCEWFKRLEEIECES